MSGGKPSTAHPSCRGSQAATHDVVEALRRVFARHAPKIKAAFIFGSVARGTDTARSDIDLMIIGELDYDEVYAVTDKAGVHGTAGQPGADFAGRLAARSRRAAIVHRPVAKVTKDFRLRV